MPPKYTYSTTNLLPLFIDEAYAYYGLTGNGRSLGLFFEQTKRAWKTWLSRRSQKAYLNWQKFNALLARYRLPPPKIVHSIYRTPANP